MKTKIEEQKLENENAEDKIGGFVLANRYASRDEAKTEFSETGNESVTRSEETRLAPEMNCDRKNFSRNLVFGPVKKRMFGRVPEPGSPEKSRFDTVLCSFASLVCGLILAAGSGGAGTLPGKPEFVSNALAVLSVFSFFLSAGLSLRYRVLVRREKCVFDAAFIRSEERGSDPA